jgi:Zn-dependent protease/predicted transcriptional regulator
VATVLFFASVLAHEFCHSLIARRHGIPVSEITLFVFGGVSQISEEASDPKTEYLIAVVGPLCSFALAFAFWLGEKALPSGSQTPETLTAAILGYVAWINVALGIFNLIPGFPLDGGRVLRAILWWKTGSLTRATRIASDVGKGFAVTLMALGGIQIFAGSLLGGIWMIFIGMFLSRVAQGGYEQTVIRKSLEGVKVGDVMVREFTSVAPDLTVQGLINDYFLHYGYKGFPVLKDGRLVGVVSLQNVKHVPEEERPRTTVGEVMYDVGEDDKTSPDASLAEALSQMNRTQSARLMVMERGSMAGIITKAGLLRFVEIKRILEP